MTIENLSVKAFLYQTDEFTETRDEFSGEGHLRLAYSKDDGVLISSPRDLNSVTTVTIPCGASITRSADSVSCKNIVHSHQFVVNHGKFDLFVRTREHGTYHLTGDNLNNTGNKRGKDIGITRRKKIAE